MAARLSIVGHLARGLIAPGVKCPFPPPDQRLKKNPKNPKKYSRFFVTLNIVYEIQKTTGGNNEQAY